MPPSNNNNSSQSLVRINRRKDVLGEEAVAKNPIDAGTIVINEPPLLVLPFSDDASSSHTQNSAPGQPKSSVSPGQDLLDILRQSEIDPQQNEKQTALEKADSSSSRSVLSSPSQQYENSLLPSLKQTEVIAASHGLSAGYFSPLVMAHYTMTKEGIVEILDWLISHVDVVNEDQLKHFLMSKKSPQQQQQVGVVPLIPLLLSCCCRSPEEERNRVGTIGFGPIKLHSSELAAATKIYENLENIFPSFSASCGNNNNNNNNNLPSASWWKQILKEKFMKDEYNPKISPFVSNNKNNNPAGKKQQQAPQFSQDEEKFMCIIMLLKWLHGVRINVHSDDVNKLTAVFKFACKFNHSCQPNTFWYLTASADKKNKNKSNIDSASTTSSSAAQNQDDDNNNNSDHDESKIILPQVRLALQKLIGNAVHVATRNIKQNEACTFSYIGCGLNMLSPTPQRRSNLRHLNFICGCERCHSFDQTYVVAKSNNNNNSNNNTVHPEVLTRSLLCGDCYGQAQMQFQQQVQLGNNKNAAAAASLPPRPSQFLSLVMCKNSTWKCTFCQAEPSYDEYSEVLMHETRIIDQVMNAFFAPINTSSQQQQQQQQQQQKRHHSSSQENAAFHEVESKQNNATEIIRKKNLARLWSALKLSVKHFSIKHYMSVVAVTSFVSHLYDQLNFVFGKNEDDEKEKSFNILFSGLLLSASKDDETSASEKNDFGLFSLILKSMAWYQSTLEGTPQQIRFKVALMNLVDILKNTTFKAEKMQALTEKLFGTSANVEQFKSLVESSFSKDKGFLKLKEFGDMQN